MPVSPTEDLLAFLGASPTPYHAVLSATTRLEGAGWSRLLEHDPWDALPGGRYYVVHEGSALLAFVVPDGPVAGFRIVGAHTDSPNLRLKPKPEYTKEGYLQLGVEVYGGALLNSWLDRDLGLAGRVLLRKEGGEGIETRLVCLDRPRVRVPQLAIHLDREVNDKGLVLNKQEHLAPILGLRASGEAEVKGLVSDAVGVPAADVLHIDLMLYDTLPPARGGAHEEIVFSARLDNLAMCHAGVAALVAASSTPSDLVPVLALFDHEEVGSQSATGAESYLLPRVLERLTRRRGRPFDDHGRALARSLCLSADMAHAVHPNYEARHEPRHKPVLNGGPVLKMNTQQRYATSARTAAVVEQIARAQQIPLQAYVNRTDLPCGSTIGPITATLLGVPTADVGNPMLSMHSCREMAGAEDPAMMQRLMAAFFVYPA